MIRAAGRLATVKLDAVTAALTFDAVADCKGTGPLMLIFPAETRLILVVGKRALLI